MFRTGFMILCLIGVGCREKNGSEKKEEGNGFSYQAFADQFRTITVPYQLSDTALLKNRDTATIRSVDFAAFLPDSMKTLFFGKNAKPRFISMGKIDARNGTSYYLVKGLSGNKRLALLYAFNNESFGAVLPFLIPDSDPSTTQVSSIDRSFSILKNVIRRSKEGVEEGKDVFEFYPDLRQFALILTNPLGRGNAEVLNPIDTLPRKHKFSGDYSRDKKNFVSIRDGRYPNQLQVFIHIEKNEGSCTGELKGEVLLTSPTSAIYQQGGDPCVLHFRFTSSSVILTEEAGCGSRRGVDCVFDGSFSRKKPAKPKPKGKNK